MEQWSFLIELLLLLIAALVFGTVAEQLRQSAIVGYLLAGALVGPHALGWVKSAESVDVIADLGVALLLFSIGLEFSFKRLKRLGLMVLLQGVLQIVVTIGVVVGVGVWLGLSVQTAFALGTMAALSSTACVLRLLQDRAEVESPHGRSAMGVLLLQDAAVLPLTLVVAAMAGGGTPGQVVLTLGRTMLFAAWMSAAFLLLFHWIVPHLLHIRRWAANREFPILLAIVMAIGSAAAAHWLEISPAMGAFLAGMLLAESPFAVQIRADVGPLRTALVTLFFVSIGMMSDPAWVAAHWQLVGAVVVGVLLGNMAIVWALFAALRMPIAVAVAAGICLAQIGEFSFVLARIAKGTLISDEQLKLVVSVTVITLLLTPYMVRLAPVVGNWVGRARFRPWRRAAAAAAAAGEGADAAHATAALPAAKKSDTGGARIIIVGFGPAGQRVAEHLLPLYPGRILIVDQNPHAESIASDFGLRLRVGNAGQGEVLEAAGIHHAVAVIVTLPDPAASRQVIHLCKQMNPRARLIVRARYHAHRWDLTMAGAEVVVDEEEQVGQKLAAEARRAIRGRGVVAAAPAVVERRKAG